MEDFYYSYPAPKQDSGSNNLIFEAPLEQYTNQNSGKEQVRLLYNSSQLQLRGGDGEQLAIEGEESGKQLFSQGVGYSAEWEDPGVYNGQIKTTFLSSATQTRQVNFSDKSGHIWTAPVELPATKNNLVNSNSASLAIVEGRLNSLLDFLREVNILAYPNIIINPLAIPGTYYWDTNNQTDFTLSDGNIITKWQSKATNNSILFIDSQSGTITLEDNIFGNSKGIRFSGVAGARLPLELSLDTDFTIFMIVKSDLAAGSRRAVQGVTTNFLIGPYNNAYQVYDSTKFIGSTPNNGNPTVLVYRQGFGSGEFYVNGELKGISNAGFSLGQLGLGAYGTYTEGMNGWFKCFGVAPRKIDSSELSSLHDFLLSNL